MHGGNHEGEEGPSEGGAGGKAKGRRQKADVKW